MHWDRTVARILLIVSFTNIALAAPAVVRPTHIGVAEAAPEKRHLDDEATDGSDGSASERMPELLSDSDSSHYFSASESLDDSSPSLSLYDDASSSGPSHHYWLPLGSEYDSSPSGSLHNDRPPASPAASSQEGQNSQHEELDHDSGPESLDSSSHASYPDPALASPAGSLHQNSADSAPELPPSSPLHQDSVPGSPLHDTVFNDALKKKLMIYGALGATTIVGLSVGLAIGVHKLIKDTHSHGYVPPFFPASSVTTF